MWLSACTDKARNLHLSDSEVVLIEVKGHTSYCDNCLKDGVTCSKLAVFAIYTDRAGNCNKNTVMD